MMMAQGLPILRGGGSSLVAEGVSYDNSQSNLTATNVQDAIDEVNNKKLSTTLFDTKTKIYAKGTTTQQSKTFTASGWKDYDFLYFKVVAELYDNPTTKVSVCLPWVNTDGVGISFFGRTTSEASPDNRCVSLEVLEHSTNQNKIILYTNVTTGYSDAWDIYLYEIVGIKL